MQFPGGVVGTAFGEPHTSIGQAFDQIVQPFQIGCFMGLGRNALHGLAQALHLVQQVVHQLMNDGVNVPPGRGLVEISTGSFE